MIESVSKLAQEATMLQGPNRPGQNGRASAWAMLLITTVLATAVSASAETRKEFHYTVGQGATISLVNENGTVTVRPSNAARDRVDDRQARRPRRLPGCGSAAPEDVWRLPRHRHAHQSQRSPHY